MHHGNHDIQHDAPLGLVDKFVRIAWAILEFAVSPFALVPEMFTRTNKGRRNFSMPGVWITAFVLLPIIFLVGSVIGDLRDNPGSWKPTLVIDPLKMQSQQSKPEVAAEEASPEMFFWSLRLYFVMAVAHKITMQIRKVRKREPESTLYSGDSRLQFLVNHVPLLRKFSVNDEDACKRFAEPAVCWLISKFVITQVDQITGNFYAWCSIALAVKGHCVRTRHQFEKDDMQDTRVKVQQLFNHMETARGNGPDKIVRVRAG